MLIHENMIGNLKKNLRCLNTLSFTSIFEHIHIPLKH